MPARFYAPALARGGDVTSLPPEEAEHLARVLRLGVGAEVHVFDGRGREYRARVETVGRRDVQVRVLDPVGPAPEPAVALTLVQAVLKGAAMDDVVRDAVMVGVAAVQPVVSARTEGAAGRSNRVRQADRWQRIAVASAKQCGRAVVPEVAAAIALETFLERQETGRACRLVLVEPRAVSAAALDAERFRGPAPPDAVILVGPEGGWTDAEVARTVRAGFEPVTIGRRTLRAAATPIVAITLLQFLWGDLTGSDRCP